MSPRRPTRPSKAPQWPPNSPGGSPRGPAADPSAPEPPEGLSGKGSWPKTAIQPDPPRRNDPAPTLEIEAGEIDPDASEPQWVRKLRANLR